LLFVGDAAEIAEDLLRQMGFHSNASSATVKVSNNKNTNQENTMFSRKI